MAKPDHLHFFIDPNRCIGCQACVQACTECDTHRGDSMIHLEFVDRAHSVQTVPVVCMHCEQPTCAEVCPADAIKRTGDGVVQSARKPRCIACGNCVLACPFGVPEVYEDRQIMMKCDMCYDRSSVGKKPMCATVCPSQALFFGTREQIEQLRPMSTPINRFQFGGQTITTRVFMMVPRAIVSPQPYVDVTAAMEEQDRASARIALTPVGGPAIHSRRWRCRGRWPTESREPIDPRIDTPGREGLTGTAPASVYRAAARRRADHDRARRAADGRAAGLAERFPDRLAAGPLRRAARLHEVHGADQPRVRRRPVLDRRRRTGGGGGAAQPGCVRVASLDEVPVRRGDDVRLSRRARRLRAGAHRARTSWSPTARSARTSRAPCGRASNEGILHCPCHEGFFDLRIGPPDRRPAAPPACRACTSRS